ncbi:nucleoside/nucleotide kinase family protein [Microbacterium sediminicola]
MCITHEDAIARVDTLSERVSGRPFLLGVVGPPGVGKSTFAAALGRPLLQMDGFHLANEYLDDLGARDRKGAPDTFDVEGYVAMLARLRSGHDVIAPRFDRDLDAAIAGALPLSGSADLIVTEGNYLLCPDGGWGGVRPLLDEVWYLTLPDAVREERLVARHRRHGRTLAEATAWVRQVDARNAEVINRGASLADLLVAAP